MNINPINGMESVAAFQASPGQVKNANNNQNSGGEVSPKDTIQLSQTKIKISLEALPQTETGMRAVNNQAARDLATSATQAAEAHQLSLDRVMDLLK